MTAIAHPRRFRRLPTAQVASYRVPVAVTLRSRLLGLSLLRPERAGEGLLIPRCRSVHTFGMRFPLDVTFLDAGGDVISVRTRIPRRRIVREAGADSVLEVPVAVGRADAPA